MGDIADMMLDGILDEQTGEFIDDEDSRKGGPGYPRTMQKGYYNSVKKRKKGPPQKHGGSHLIGKKVLSPKFGNCIIKDYVGKRGKKRYVITDKDGNDHKVRFSQIQLK